jgi:signal transduction histidine kinase
LISPDAKADVQPIDVAEFVDLVAGQFTSEEWQRVTIDSSLADLTGDPDKLLVACKELLKNALKATTECVRWTIGTNTMVFANLGSLPVNVEFFEPWTKGDVSRGTTGNGMGLPIVLQVMNLHEGKATIEQKGKDVVVTISWRTGMQGKG